MVGTRGCSVGEIEGRSVDKCDLRASGCVIPPSGVSSTPMGMADWLMTCLVVLSCVIRVDLSATSSSVKACRNLPFMRFANTIDLTCKRCSCCLNWTGVKNSGASRILSTTARYVAIVREGQRVSVVLGAVECKMSPYATTRATMPLREPIGERKGRRWLLQEEVL
jgi:hypothetical protein